MSAENAKLATTGRRVRTAAVVLLAIYALSGVLLVAKAWADAQSSQEAIIPSPGIVYLKPPTGSSDRVVSAYYDYLQKMTYATLPEQYHLDIPSLLIMYAVLGINIGGIYVFVIGWYYSRLRKNDLYPVEVYNGLISERAGPFDILNYYLWTLMGLYIVVYIVINLIFAQLY